MSLTIKADPSGTSGTFQIGGVDVLKIGGDNSGQLQGFRNRIINGCCRIAQRGPVAATLNTYVYGGSDRICFNPSGYSTASGTIQNSPNFTDTGEYGQAAAGMTTTGSGSMAFQTRLEAANTSDLNNETVTFSVVVYQNTGAPVDVVAYIQKPTTTIDTFSAQTTLATNTTSVPSGTNTKITLTVALGSTDASLGLSCSVFFPTGAVTSKNFVTGKWQLEKGSIASEFEVRPYGLELQLCQRYYEVIVYPGYYIQGVSTITRVWGPGNWYKVVKRATPTVTLPASTNQGLTYVGGTSTPATWAVYLNNTQAFTIDCSSTGGYGANTATSSIEL